MGSAVTPKWVAGLRRDLREWDCQVESRHYRDEWPNISPTLTYGESLAVEVSMSDLAVTSREGLSCDLQVLERRRRRASTGSSTPRPSRLPSEIYSQFVSKYVTMQLKYPAHVWAMLTTGRETESVTFLDAPDIPGFRIRENWREHDGERGLMWRTRIRGGDAGPLWRERVYMQRMTWTRSGGVWRGEWRWEECEKRRRRARLTGRAGSAIPQEVLLCMVCMYSETRDYDWQVRRSVCLPLTYLTVNTVCEAYNAS